VNLDLEIIRCIVGKDDKKVERFDKAKRLGINKKNLVEKASDVWEFIDSYRDKYNEVPKLEIIESIYGQKISKSEEEANFEWVISEILKRDLFQSLKQGITKVYKELEKYEPENALKEIERIVEVSKRKKTSCVEVKNLMNFGEDVIDLYNRTKRGDIGIRFPWPSMNKMTMGLWPQTLTFFAARPGTGKTFMIVIILLFAWREGSRVLLISPEMSASEIAERFFSIQLKVSYKDVVGGTLGNFAESTFFKGIRELKGTEGFYILDNVDKMYPRAIEEAIEEIKPDVVGIDSVYMIKSDVGNRYDRMLITIDWLRELTKKTNIPIVALTQFNRDVKKGKGFMENLAMTDVITWDCHNLFGLYQDKDMKSDKIMEFQPLKIRRHVLMNKIRSHWDFELMDFSEIGVKDEFTDEDFDGSDCPF
jgi:replicative DNA helicase